MTRAPLIGLVLALLATAAQAHPRFVEASPARNAVIRAAPKEIRVSFSEAPLPDVSILQLKNAGGRPVKAGRIAADPKDRQTLVLPLPARLAPGKYVVEWDIATEEHNSVPGRYRFEVSR